MCGPWDTGCVANQIAIAVSNTVLGQVSMTVVTAQQWLIDTTASWWVLVPSIKLYPDAGNTEPGAPPIDAVAALRGLILPIIVIVAMGGMLWNGLLMVLSRKPAPLVDVLRGLWNTALWSAVGIFGTNLLLYGTDRFSAWVITSALSGVGEPSFAKRMSALLIPVTGAGGLPPGVVILVGGIAMVASFVQAILMLFRDGSVLILAACTPLAASGSFTRATGGWLRKLVAWQLALVFYKPAASMVYATAIWLQGENSSRDPRVFLMGVAMLLVALVALPVLLRFFNWTVGGLQSGGGGLGLLATAGAAGMHAASSLRGAGGGFGVNEHARYLSEMFDRGSSTSGGGPPGPGPAGLPNGASGPTPGPGPASGPGPVAAPGVFKPPAFVGGAGGGKVATITSAGGTATGGTTGATSAASGAASAGGTASVGTAAATGVSAATGPAAPVVAGTVVVAGAAVTAATGAANAAASAASEAAKGR